MNRQSSHRTVSEYTVNNAPEREGAAYEVVCPLLPCHGKPNMMRTACESRRGAAAKSDIRCACKCWPECAQYEEDKTEYLHRTCRTAMTTMVGIAMASGKTYEVIVAEYGLTNKQIAKHKRIIMANPDLYPEFTFTIKGEALPLPEGSVAPRPIRSAAAVAAGKEIVALYHQGFTRTEIAKRVCRGPETVSQRLREAGIFGRNGARGSLRQEILTYLAEAPDATYRQIQEKFKCARSTAEAYRGEYKKGRRAIVSPPGPH